MKYLVLSISLLCLSTPVWAHPGGLNSQGCHNNRKTGDYHCHRSAKPKPQSTPKRDSNPSFLKPNQQTWMFKNCTEARRAGKAPVYRGQPGFGPHLDRDNDGIGCE